MELYYFITVVTLLKFFGLINILMFVFSLLMMRHLHKKYLQDDKKYKLYNKIKINGSNKYKKLVSKSNENKVISKIVMVIKKGYNFVNKYFKLIFNEVMFMFSDLFNEVVFVNIKATKNKPMELNMDKYLSIFNDFNKTITQFNKINSKTNELINKNDLNNFVAKENYSNLDSKISEPINNFVEKENTSNLDSKISESTNNFVAKENTSNLDSKISEPINNFVEKENTSNLDNHQRSVLINNLKIDNTTSEDHMKILDDEITSIHC